MDKFLGTGQNFDNALYMALTLKRLKSLTLHPSAACKLYPPLPGRPASPAGFGIRSVSDSSDADDSSDATESGDADRRNRGGTEGLNCGMFKFAVRFRSTMVGSSWWSRGGLAESSNNRVRASGIGSTGGREPWP